MMLDEIEGLADRIAESAAHIDAATHSLIRDIGILDASEGWHRMGASSCANYLSWRIGLGRGAAREKVRVARALPALPAIDAAFASGRVSYSKVRAMTRVATPDNEALLLEVALGSTAAQLEHACRLLRGTQQDEADPALARDRRWVTSRGTADGMVSVQLRLQRDEAALVMQAIDAFQPADGDRADGAVALAEVALAERRCGGWRSRGDASANADADANTDADADADAGADADADESAALPAGNPDERSRGDADTRGASRAIAPATDVFLTIDAAMLTGETQLGDGIPASTCRRILCDAGVVPVLVDERGASLDIGRKSRLIPPAIRRALHRRDKGCRFPGCDSKYVHAHHMEHWLSGGATRLSNLLSLCHFHHAGLHDGLFSLSGDVDAPVFHDSRGRLLRHAPARPAGVVTVPRACNQQRGIEIDHNTSTPNWDGRPLDHHWIIAALCAVPQKNRLAT